MSMLALLLATQVAATTLAPPPSPAMRPPTETRFGITLEDPDRWLEDLANPAAQSWLKGQAEFTRGTLDSIAPRAELLAEIERLENTTSAKIASIVLMPGDRLLIQRQEAGMDTPRLYLREGWDGKDRLLLDPEDWKKKTGKPHSINYATPSPDGTLAVVGLSESGSEMASAYLIDLASGKQLEPPISRVRFGISWLPDGSGYFYNRQIELAPGQPESERQLNSQAWLHRLGSDVAKDALVFGNRYDKSLGIDAAQLPVVVSPTDSRYLIGLPYSVDNRLTIFVAPLAELATGKLAWRKLITPEDAVRAFTTHGDDLYLLSSKSPSRSIERLSLADGKRSTAVPAGLLPIDSITSNDEALFYIAKRESGVGAQLYRLAWNAERATPLELPGIETLQLHATNVGGAGLAVSGADWSHFPSVVRVDPQGRVHPTQLQPAPSGVDASQLQSTVVQVKSHDGALVPLSIVHRRDLVRDGSAPTFMQGYGAYGFNTEPFLVPAHFAYFDRGFVRAFCHVRGGGEKGEAWYRAGYQGSKANTWKDFIACAEYLVQQKYTSPRRLGIGGGSAGGILIGNALLARPDLFAAAIPSVGVLDSVAAALRDPNGPVNWPEFGDPTTEEGFKALVGMSAYHKVKDGTAYPAVMLTHGFNDPRVAVWHSAKMGARLQRASTSGKPVLLNIDYEAGHGVGTAQSSVNRQRADLISFMLWQFGVEGFAPQAAAGAAPASGR
jgi:prolyl oligopeptidase